jgi:glycerate kinase
MSRYLIAPNAFKHALSARPAAEAVARGIRRADPKAVCNIFPVGDGGDGTGALIVQHLEGRLVHTKAEDPLGRLREAEYGLVDDGRTAVVELASASGLRLLTEAERDPSIASTFGTGMLMRDALDRGVGKVLLCVGGSATVDGGMGILRALGLRFEDAEGCELVRPSQLRLLDRLDVSGMRERMPAVAFEVLCDVRNPLLGPRGAASVFGPQKGADPEMVSLLEKGLRRFSEVLARDFGVDVADADFGGAAGGAAAGMLAVLGARLVSGIDSFLDLTGFDRALEGADVVVTGEGSLDAQTLEGKAPMGVAKRAGRAGRKVVGLAGRITEEVRQSSAPFDMLLEINEGGGTLEQMLRDTAVNLERAGVAIASIGHC